MLEIFHGAQSHMSLCSPELCALMVPAMWAVWVLLLWLGWLLWTCWQAGLTLVLLHTASNGYGLVLVWLAVWSRGSHSGTNLLVGWARIQGCGGRGGLRAGAGWLWVTLYPCKAECWSQEATGLVPIHQWVGELLELIHLEEARKKLFSKTSVLVVEKTTQNGCHQQLYPQGES